MELRQYQEILARLYTDKNFRESFFRDRTTTYQQLHISEKNTQLLNELSKLQVEQFAHSLISKRLEAAKSILVLTSRQMGNYFAKAFFEYASCNKLEESNNKYLTDALSFTKFLLGKSKFESNEPFQRELIRHEQQRINSAFEKKKITIHKFNYKIEELILFLEGKAGNPRKKIIYSFGLRKRNSQNFNYFSIALPTLF